MLRPPHSAQVIDGSKHVFLRFDKQYRASPPPPSPLCPRCPRHAIRCGVSSPLHSGTFAARRRSPPLYAHLLARGCIHPRCSSPRPSPSLIPPPPLLSHAPPSLLPPPRARALCLYLYVCEYFTLCVCV